MCYRCTMKQRAKKPNSEAAAGTEFRRWRHVMGFTQEQAATALGLSVSHVKNWDAGEDRGRGTPAIPSLVVRYVMAELAKGTELEPWPAEAVKPSAKRKRQAA